MPTVFLIVTVFFVSENGLAMQQIPQANMAQCEVNRKYYNGLRYEKRVNSSIQYRAQCIVGAK